MMQRWYSRLLAGMILLTGAPGRMTGDGPPPAPTEAPRDPDEVFNKTCERLVALEAQHDLLKGISRARPVMEHDKKKHLTSARLVFERNATSPGKNSAKPRDESRPFVYVSVQVWSGRSQQPPANLVEFSWQGQIYQCWVRVDSSDARLVQTIRRAVDEPLRQPPLPQQGFVPNP